MILIHRAAPPTSRFRPEQGTEACRAGGLGWGNLRTILLLLAIVSVTPGCGQKGDLYLPGDAPEAVAE